MKQIIIFSLIIVFCFYSTIYSQFSFHYLDYTMSPYLEYYSTNIHSSVSAGKGNTGVASSGDVSLIYLNPATLNITKKFQVNAGYNMKSKSINAYHTLSQNLYSFSFACAYRVNKNFQMGLAYQNDYSYEQEPQYMLSPYLLNNNLETHSFRVPVVYEYKFLRIGMNINLSYYKASYLEPDEAILIEGITGSFWKLNPEIGTVITPIKEFSIGASFIPGFKKDFQYKLINEVLYVEPYAKYPNRIKIGTEIRTSNNDTKFTFDYFYANTSYIKGLKDQNDIHLGFEQVIDENWTFRCGFFSNRTIYDDRIYFLTFGTSFKFYNYSFNLAGLVNMGIDSSIGEYYVLNFGAGYEF